MPRREPLIKALVILAFVIAALVPTGYLWIIVSAKLELGGASPGEAVVGTTSRVEQRARQQYCTGVLATPKNTWLVGRMDRAEKTEGQPGIDLDALIRGNAAEQDDEEPSGFGGLFGGGLSSDPQTTYLSRLDDKGEFVQVAHLGETACLVATPDGDTLYLLTGVNRPEDAQQADIRQTVVLRSDDQGTSWAPLEQGLLAEANDLAWSLEPYFFDNQQVWAWASLPQSGSAYGEPENLRGGLYYSPDQGATREAIIASDDLLVSLDAIRSRAPEGVNWGDYNGGYGRITSHVQQFDDQHAAIWVSQSFLYGEPDGKYLTTPVFVTSKARLVRDGGQWRMGPLEREYGLHLDEVVSNDDERVIAVIEREGDEATQVAELDRQTLAWQPRGSLPSPFWPLPSSTGLRGFSIGKRVLLANTDSSYSVPLWLYPTADGEPATISSDAVFYSRDWGRSWSRLAIEGYLGVQGLDPRTDRVFWAEGDWYDVNPDKRIHSYRLD
ncbi:hypothetical protein [Pseudomonas tohonis]|uniref:hypothetical protein n=1 Tax=Pseudomonas tohonis TaxID=2725477 RepID=UPI0021D93BF1|nr:hypothetical protein [Pseudomonas tohonis]UXY52672.1 hypothetical protein N9L84_27605 [Pseudomonas tohonis]